MTDAMHEAWVAAEKAGPVAAREFDAGVRAAAREIDEDGWTFDTAAAYLREIEDLGPVSGAAAFFDSGFTAEVRRYRDTFVLRIGGHGRLGL